jgi:hypothetical protein
MMVNDRITFLAHGEDVLVRKEETNVLSDKIQFRGEMSILQQSHIRNNWNTTAATIMSDNALGRESIKLVMDIDRETAF